MKSTSDIFKTFIEKTERILWVLGMHAFALILIIVVIEIIWGSFIFYNYTYLAEFKQPQITGIVLKFDDKAYKSVMAELQAREIGESK